MIGRVYRLIGGGKYYYGSTMQTLACRFSHHKATAKKRPMPCHKHFNEIGWDGVQIELIEEGEFEYISDLRKLERIYILAHKDDDNCLNCNVPIAQLNRCEYNKLYYKAHRDEYIAKSKEQGTSGYYKTYYETHRDEIIAKCKNYKAKKKLEMV